MSWKKCWKLFWATLSLREVVVLSKIFRYPFAALIFVKHAHVTSMVIFDSNLTSLSQMIKNWHSKKLI